MNTFFNMKKSIKKKKIINMYLFWYALIWITPFDRSQIPAFKYEIVDIVHRRLEVHQSIELYIFR